MTQAAAGCARPVNVEHYILFVPDRGDVGMGEKEQTRSLKNRLGKIHYYVSGRVPREKDARFRATVEVDIRE
jgi:hypothetical protein